MTDRQKLEEICKKYGNDDNLRKAVTEAFEYKEKEDFEMHKPLYMAKDFKNYKRHLVQLREDTVLLLHIFKRDLDQDFESAWLDDNDEYYIQNYEVIKDSAKQLLRQLEGHYCTAFIEALRDECNEIIEHDKQSKTI